MQALGQIGQHAWHVRTHAAALNGAAEERGVGNEGGEGEGRCIYIYRERARERHISMARRECGISKHIPQGF